ncbi:MAG TPA: bifunctional phosphopantothenoylcysteine decarboxylase/phosphopantothenate--cysteine ligase CoaBC [Acidimicrobiales bacterium]|nr:bifunctional phosphopantothenoylcysteine decarboxylase/phosphopantothenate--cysteine ligase CoaBC [Acidimicrobiales bacterium]
MENDATPTSLRGATVVLGVTGGIAAYKAVEVCRRLVDAGAHVVPLMTHAATRFVGPTTFSALASEPVHTTVFDAEDPIPHTRLGQRADLVIVCPATADAIARYAAGLAGDLLGATLLATEAPVLLCPAMHTEMWRHPSVRSNLDVLRARGVQIVEPASGRLAGGDVGEGRLADPEGIVRRAASILTHSGDLVGRRIVISAGGTREPIDPVRFLSNRSSGKQGYALAAAAAERGAVVTLVSTVELHVPPGVDVVHVDTAEELLEAMLTASSDADLVVMAAAVADFRVKAPASSKLKRHEGVPELVLEPTPDVLAALVAHRPASQLIFGFAAETDDPIGEGRRKLAEKRLDAICINDVSLPDVGFSHETNALVILDRDGGRRDVELTTKRAAADAVLDVAVALSTRTAT